jgi:V/A-type H+-transporting ATPase subunit D
VAKIKHTKTALKAQRDALRRFERYLPTLLLKKQQLQQELRRLEAQLEEKEAAEKRVRVELDAWVKLFAEPFDFVSNVKIVEFQHSVGNIAGVAIPLLRELRCALVTPDLFATSPWVDDGLSVLEKLLRLEIEQKFMRAQRRLLAEELRVTSQRVNLFEKVKIPEAKENIRVIRIYLGDQQTADVARGKLAKGRSAGKEERA